MDQLIANIWAILAGAFANIWAILAGALTMSVLWLFVSSWIRTIAERRAQQPPSSWATIAATSLLHAAPWAIALAIAFAVYIHAAPWAAWFFGGAIGSVIFVGLFVGFALRQLKRQRGSNAA